MLKTFPATALPGLDSWDCKWVMEERSFQVSCIQLQLQLAVSPAEQISVN